MITAVLAWCGFCAIYLAQALFRESFTWERLKQRFALWRQVRHDIGHATPERKQEIEDFLAVLEAILQDRGHLSYAARALNIEERTLRAVKIIAAMPKSIAVEIIERTQIARGEIDRTRTARGNERNT
jgi:hypothetical protein